MIGKIGGSPKPRHRSCFKRLRSQGYIRSATLKRQIGNQKQVEHDRLMVASGIQEARRMEYLIRKADRITRFPAKMSPRLAYWYLRRTFSDESNRERTFYDPMCGSGTSALVAVALGYSVLASDISYAAVIIARAKLTKLTKNELNVLREFPATIKISVSRPSASWSNWKIWYQPLVLRTLEVLRDAIFDEEGEHYFPHLLSCFFQTAWDVSAADKGVIVPTRSRFSKRAPGMKPQRVIYRFRERLNRIIAAQDALSQLQLSTHRPSVKLGDALSESVWPRRSIDVCMTSPPYGCGIDYERAFRLPMKICKGLIPEFVKARMIGRQSHLKDDATTIQKYLDETVSLRRIGRSEALRAKMLVQYFVDMKRFLGKCSKHLKSEGRLCLVVGNPEIAKKRVPLVNVIVRMARDQRLQLIAKPRADRIPTRSMNFAPRSATRFIREEYLLTFRRT